MRRASQKNLALPVDAREIVGCLSVARRTTAIGTNAEELTAPNGISGAAGRASVQHYLMGRSQQRS